AVLRQIALGGGRAALAQREVVFVGAAAVRAALDPDPDTGVRVQDGHLGIQGRLVLIGEVGLVEVEEDLRHQRVPGGGDGRRQTVVLGGDAVGHALGVGQRVPIVAAVDAGRRRAGRRGRRRGRLVSARRGGRRRDG